MNVLLSWRPNAEQAQTLRTVLRRSTRVSHHLFSVVGGVSVLTAAALWAFPGARSAMAEHYLPVLEAALQAGPARLLNGNPLPSMAATDGSTDAADQAHAAAIQPVSYQQPASAVADPAAITATVATTPAQGQSPVAMAQQIPARQIDADARDHGNASARAEAMVATYLSRRYHVAEEPIGNLVKAAYQTGQATNLDPLLLLSVMAIESGFNPYAESGVGAKGLMQVMAKVHSDKFQYFGGQQAALKPLANLQVGALVLKDCIARGGSLSGGLRLYNGVTTDDDGGYSARVLAERSRLREVSRGLKPSETAQAGLVKVSTRTSGPAKRVHATLVTASMHAKPAAVQSDDTSDSTDQSSPQLGT